MTESKRNAAIKRLEEIIFAHVTNDLNEVLRIIDNLRDEPIEMTEKKIEFIARKLCLNLEGDFVESEVVLDTLPQLARNGHIVIRQTCKLWELYLHEARLALHFAKEYDEKEAKQSMTDETVTITKKEYERLLDSELRLEALAEGGVDTWEWYDDAMANYKAKLEELKDGTPNE